MASPPDILWIVTTQWRASATGYAGDPNARTPWLDGMAAEAVNHVQAVTPHPLGPQARAALLTGRLCPENGVSDYWDPLPGNARTVAHALADRGYATAFFGKWHLAKRDRTVPLVGEVHARQSVPPEARGGFGFWEGFEGGFLLNDPWLHGTRLSAPRHFKGYQADILVERAAEWLAQAKALPQRRPAFCVVSLESPHPPYAAPASRITPGDPARIELAGNVPRGGAVEAKARAELAGYYAHIGATDRAIGKLMVEVDLAGTIVVFTSVHGDMHGSHGLFRKAWPYEESVRVPLLVWRKGPAGGLPPKGRVSEAPVSLVDLPHMAVAWAEGREWINRHDSALISMPSAPAFPLQCDRSWRGFRSSRHKFVLNADGSPWLYFDLEADPMEMKNLAGDPGCAGEIERLKTLLG